MLFICTYVLCSTSSNTSESNKSDYACKAVDLPRDCVSFMLIPEDYREHAEYSLLIIPHCFLSTIIENVVDAFVCCMCIEFQFN